jgi:alpha-mannosidase
MDKTRIAFALLLIALTAVLAAAKDQVPTTQPLHPALHPGTLYMVGYSHLDTQWRWTYPTVIADFIPYTMTDNLRLFAKYPHYIFNWTGANRYRLMKEYYPSEFKKVQQAVKDGRWFPAGSAWEESLADEPSAEALVRQVLYGNGFFRTELGKASNEMMLPDTFGFPASLPTILAHCGLKGFSTQKLTWGSAVGVPFNLGKWIGPDGRSIVAALDAGNYTTKVKNDPTTAPAWVKRVEANGKRDGVYVDYRYYGVGDRGGAPDEQSIRLVNKAVSEAGPIKVISATAAQMFDELTPEQLQELPTYTGDLLLTNHSAGTPTSQAFQKWLNRKNELLADDAERASVAAELLGAEPYPRNKITDGWHLLLAGQFHDILAGTGLPKAIEYSWADGMLAQNELRTARNDAVGAVCRTLDTRGQGTPLVLYNPLSIQRQDVAQASVVLHNETPKALEAIGPDGQVAPAQILSSDGNTAHVALLATVPSVGFAVYDLRPATQFSSGELKVTQDSLENHRYRVRLNAAGDVSEIFDKVAKRELLSAPARLAFLHEEPKQYPAWNVDYIDRTTPPYAYVDGPAQVKIVEKGPVRIALEVRRSAQGSTFVQTIRLAAGEAGNRLEFATDIDWHSSACALKAVFPLTVSNPLATYNWEAGTIQRDNNNPKKFEVPSHQWFDLTDRDGKYGVAVLEDCKYASDKPDDSTLRLTLLRTPGVNGKGNQDQATQDFGRHHVLYALQGHVSDWREGDTQWEAMRLNQPLTAFVAPMHEGANGKTFSLLSLNTRQVAVRALKLAEDGDRIVVRLQELDGRPAKDVKIQTASQSNEPMQEVDGQERLMGPAGDSIDMGPYGLRAFSLGPWHAVEGSSVAPPRSQPIALPFNVDVITPRISEDAPPASTQATATKNGAGFDAAGDTLPAEMLPATWESEGIAFNFGHAGAANAVACQGQQIAIPAGQFNRIYLLGSASDGEAKVEFRIGDIRVPMTVEDWSGYIGLTDNRVWKGTSFPEIDYNWGNHFAGLTPGFVRPDPVGWYSSHRHGPDGANQIYQYCYLFKYRIDLPAGAATLTLPNEPRVKILAATAAQNDNDDVTPPTPRWPWEGIAFTNPSAGESEARTEPAQATKK